ncbi:Uncharacterised protein [Serratia quinivorans]|uniref:hypothetical protein n=1 Tax=Serratia quinivorans TaxID=137545 RepID=UPI002178D07A|nr:hypothetical protein [Serratia quinivorans]CAI1769047.1 Uncharacterised protein [Serratia quinivorans]
MTTELKYQQNLETAAQNLQGIQPIPVTQGSVIPAQWSAANMMQGVQDQPDIKPPSEDNIQKNMWIASGMVGLVAALATGNAASGLAAGMWGALAIHDHGYALRERGKYTRQLAAEGYSYPAILDWYKTGNNKVLEDERKGMDENGRFNAKQRQDAAEANAQLEDHKANRASQETMARESRQNSMAIASMQQSHADARAREVTDRQLAKAVKGSGAASFDPTSPTAPADATRILANMTSDQVKNGQAAHRIDRNLTIIDGLLGGGSVSPQRAGAIAKALGNGDIGNLALSANEQRYVNAIKETVNTIQRKESGAAISDAEWADAFGRYLPSAGDSPALARQKNGQLHGYKDELIAGAGGAYPAFKYAIDGLGSAGNSQPKVGDVDDGYRYIGGDPKNQSSWEKVND